MTQTPTLDRPAPPAAPAPPSRPQPAVAPTPPAHPHWTLGSLAVLGVVTALIAAMVGVGALFVVASRDSVDDALVADLVAEDLAANPPVAAGAPVGDVIPELVPKAQLALAPAGEAHVALPPAVPPPIARTAPAIVEVAFDVVEGLATIDPETGVQFETWGYRVTGGDATYTGTPGPIIRARVGDVLRFTITNPATNTHPHNVDFHAVTGQGGGAADTTVAPGETATIEARMLYPGIFMYHCAYGDVPEHISHGMYGGILVDPAEPLPPADQEWYIVQSEYYTTEPVDGVVQQDRAAITAEHPSYVVFNGAVGAIAGDNALTMNVGERARIYFVNAGLNLDSNFHPIGSHWDAVYPEGATLAPPIRGSQTTLVPAGGGVVVDLVGQVPSNIILVDHALSRTFDKGALGVIAVQGDANAEIFDVPAPAGQIGAAPAADAGAAVEGDVGVEILAGSWEPQDMGAADEFADSETPADYSANVLTVPVGTTVTWSNADEQLHTVTAVDGSFDSGFFGNGESWSFTFDAPGEYEYFCTPHPWMRAKVIVEG